MPDLSIFSSNLPATIALFAAGITAFFASLKFFSDKAAKVTDFRKAWIETLRQAVAEFSGHTHTIVGRIAIRKRHGGSFFKTASEPAKRIDWRSWFGQRTTVKSQFDKEFETELLDHWSGLRLSYNKLILHLNPAEHRAYTLAEEAIAAYSNVPEKKEIRDQVATFLDWCIVHAEGTSRDMLKKMGHVFPSLTNESAEQMSILDEQGNKTDVSPEAKRIRKSLPTALDTAATKIAGECKDGATSLLLSAFATRQLLHGEYEQVHGNVSRIERGIRAVDTSAALVIKGVWEAIKRGRTAIPLYQLGRHRRLLIPDRLSRRRTIQRKNAGQAAQIHSVMCQPARTRHIVRGHDAAVRA